MFVKVLYAFGRVVRDPTWDEIESAFRRLPGTGDSVCISAFPAGSMTIVDFELHPGKFIVIVQRRGWIDSGAVDWGIMLKVARSFAESGKVTRASKWPII